MTSAKRASRLLAAALMCVCAIGVLGAGSAAAEGPGSMTEATAEGNPAATAPTVVTPAIYTYNGERISEGEAAGLACMQNPGGFVCKDSAEEFDGASSSRARKGGKATASFACGVNPLWIYEHKQYGGTSLGLAWFGAWYDVPAAMNNQTTSFRTGEGQAHLSDFGGGGGFWYPGPTGVCDYHSNISQPYPEWNDRISSRYRF